MTYQVFWAFACASIWVGLTAQGCAGSSNVEGTQDTETESDSATATESSVDTNSGTNGDTSIDTNSATNIDTNGDTDSDTETPSHTDTGLDTDTSQGLLTFPLRAAFYYLWYPQTWTVEGEHVFYHPDLGYYSSDDSDVVDQHIRDLEYAKIDVAIASWWRIGHQNEDTRIPLVLDRTVALGSSLKWAFYYESEGFGDPTPQEIKANLDYLMSSYVDHEAIAKIDGKPVVFVYNADDKTCDVATRWSQANDGDWYVNLKVIQGFKDCPDQPDSWHQYGPNTPAGHHAGYSYVIAPGFWRADHESPTLARDVDRWWTNVADMVASQEPWQLITTFNEWGEGTAVEPASEWASDSGYGQYLDALHSDGVK